MTHSVIIVDDHEVVRYGIRAFLRTTPEFRVVAEASDGIEAVRLVEQYQPDLVTLDITLPGLCGLETTKAIKRVSSRTRVLIVSMHSTETHVARAFRNGAGGYVRKNAPFPQLLEALREVAAGRRYLDRNLPECVDEYLAAPGDADFDPLEALSIRERQILQLTAEGKSAHAIGEQLFISPRTVESHRANIMRKLGLKTHSDLVLFAVRNGMVTAT